MYCGSRFTVAEIQSLRKLARIAAIMVATSVQRDYRYYVPVPSAGGFWINYDLPPNEVQE